MVEGDPSSGWWFYGRLRPAAATRFNVQQVRLQDETYLEIFHDMIGVWSKPAPYVIEGRRAARELFDLVVSAYAFISRVVLDWSLEGWVEAAHASFSGTVMGVVVDPRGHDPELPPNSRQSVEMRHAAELAVAVWGMHGGYRLALRDIRAALADDGDDAFVFAFRALEDLAYAYSFRRGQLQPADWSRLAEHLGMADEDFKARKKPLKDARDMWGHGDTENPELAAARAAREALIEEARQIVAEALHRDSGVPFDIARLAD